MFNVGLKDYLTLLGKETMESPFLVCVSTVNSVQLQTLI